MTYSQYGDTYTYEGQQQDYPGDYVYYYSPVKTDGLSCVAFLADYMMFRLILMPVFPHQWSAGHVHTASAAYTFQSRVQSCTQIIESMTERLGLMSRDSYSLAVWLEQKTELKKMTERNKSGVPSLDPSIQQELVRFSGILLEELQQTDKKDVTALYHMCYLTMRLILFVSFSSHLSESDGTSFLSVVEKLPQNRLTTYYKTKLETANLLILRFLETPDTPGSTTTLIDHLGFLLYKLNDNIKASNESSTTKTKSTTTVTTTTTRSKARTTGVPCTKVTGEGGQYLARPMWVTPPGGGQPRLLYVLDPEQPAESSSTTTRPVPQQTGGLSGAVAAAAVQSDKNSGIPSADELGMTEDEFAAHLQQQLMLEDMHAQKDLAYNSSGKTQSSLYSTSSHSDLSTYYPEDLEPLPQTVKFVRGDKTSELSPGKRKYKPTKEPKMPKDLEMLESLTQMEEYVELQRRDYEEKQLHLDRILGDKQQLEMALKETDIPVIKQALETELRDKTQFLSLRRQETEIAKRKLEELDTYMESRKRSSAPRQIEDLDARATYQLLQRNLERMQGNPNRLHLMLDRHVDILDAETLAELSTLLGVEAKTREDRIAEIKKRHLDTLEELEDEPLD